VLNYGEIIVNAEPNRLENFFSQIGNESTFLQRSHTENRRIANSSFAVRKNATKESKHCIVLRNSAFTITDLLLISLHVEYFKFSLKLAKTIISWTRESFKSETHAKS